MSRRLALVVPLAIAACSPAPTGSVPAASPAASPSPVAAPDYTGRWLGVEGMVLDVKPGATPATYCVAMQYDLDHRQTTDATRVGDTLTFERDGRTLTLRPSDGDATGLKYLAGKKHCLTVAPGEGYCRD